MLVRSLGVLKRTKKIQFLSQEHIPFELIAKNFRFNKGLSTYFIKDVDESSLQGVLESTSPNKALEAKNAWYYILEEDNEKISAYLKDLAPGMILEQDEENSNHLEFKTAVGTDVNLWYQMATFQIFAHYGKIVIAVDSQIRPLATFSPKIEQNIF